MDQNLPETDWNVGTPSGLVNIGTSESPYHIHFALSGPARSQNSPLVLLIPGLGSSITSWAAVIRLLSPHAQILAYSRSGYGASDTSALPSSAVNIAVELFLLLEESRLKGPYVLVAHSWGGVIACEFLALLKARDRVGEVVGAVFVDANQPKTLEVLDWRVMAHSPLLEGVDYNAVCLSEHRLFEEEIEGCMEEMKTEAFQKQAQKEVEAYAGSFPVIKAKNLIERVPPILGDTPVCVVKGDSIADFRKLLDAALVMENGVGKEDEVKRFRERLGEDWRQKDRILQKELLLLTAGEQKWVELLGKGHNLQLMGPEEIVEAVKWVLERIGQKRE